MTPAFRAILIVLGVLLAGYVASEVFMPCGVPPGQSCSTDMECACMHGEEP